MRLLIINQIILIGSNKMKHNMNSIMPCMDEMAKKKILIRRVRWNVKLAEKRKKSLTFYCHLNTVFSLPHSLFWTHVCNVQLCRKRMIFMKISLCEEEKVLGFFSRIKQMLISADSRLFLSLSLSCEQSLMWKCI